MKKIFNGLLALAMTTSGLGMSTLQAKDNLVPLYQYEDNGDGTYSYDESQQIPYYYANSTDNTPESDEKIMIPATYENPKQQFKGTWIATIFNLHFPKSPTEAEFQANYEARLDELESWNMNAVFFQVRPLLDTFYPSDLNPTSEYLSGKQGMDVDFDPLAYMVDATHARGMEYHAWFNPYRVTNSDYASKANVIKLGFATEAEFEGLATTSNEYKELQKRMEVMTTEEIIAFLNEDGTLADSNYAVLNPEHVLRYAGKLQLNPGIPEVIEYVTASIKEVTDNYDVDAIHFDDYFYPYKAADRTTGKDLFSDQDRTTFETYGLTAGYEDTDLGLDAWRRDNVTRLITNIKSDIDVHNEENKASVQFGISPFGIWEHHKNDERGSHSPTSSSQSYSKQIYADTYDWIKNDYLDYVAPQIYWAFGTTFAPYGELTRWWNDVADGTDVQIYIGHANYKSGTADKNWKNPDEITNQIRFNQTQQNIYGSALYGYNDILPSTDSVKNAMLDSLRGEAFAERSLSPAKPWLSHGVELPTNVALDENTDISWSTTADGTTRFFHIYEGNATSTTEEIISTTANLVATIPHENQADYTHTLDNFNAAKKYVITAEDKAHVESEGIEVKAVEEETTDNNEESSENNEESSVNPLEKLSLNTDVKFERDSKLTEEEFIKALDIKWDRDFSVATTFNELDTSKIGKQIIDVTVTELSNARAISDTHIMKVNVEITEKATSGTPETGLPATGESVRETLLLSTVLLLTGAITIFFIKRRR